MASLGAFAVGKPIGEGGMGRVFAAEHLGTNLPVAIKLMTAARALEPRYIRGFTREIQAVARLQHRSISAVYEYGEVTDLEADSNPEFRAGSPWVAMELASQGSLEERLAHGADLDWATLHRVLLEILDGLAYAHARGVIHRDLKPSNLLLHNGNVRIADFGIAHVIRPERDFDETEVHNATAGTASYMAPEQFFGRWRDYGPATDIYALGCLTYELVTGAPPFVAEHRLDLAKMHNYDPVPPLKPQFAVPAGLQDWLFTATRKDHRRRFITAADAARALLLLGDPVKVEWSRPTSQFAGPDEETVEAPPALFARRRSDTGPTALTFVQATLPMAPPLAPEGSADTSERPSGPARVPPLMSSVVSPAARDEHNAPMGLGLSLFGMREISLVGREVERRTLWSALARAHENRTVETVVLRGAAGTGKSRLAEWLCTQALEVGAAHVLRARHSAGSEPAEAIRRMLSHRFMAFGLDHIAARERIQAALTAASGAPPAAYDVAALAQITTHDDAAEFEFSSPKQRYTVVRRLLETLANDRPVLLWLDDVQWGSDALGLTQFLMNGRAVPLLIVLTVRDEQLERRPLEASLLAHLTALDQTTECQIGALRTPDLDQLTESLVPLSSELRELIGRESCGSPLHAVQLVEHLIREGALTPNEQGRFTVSADAAELPENLEALCESRVEQMLNGLPDSGPVRDALEVGAALGMHVNRSEWEEALPDSTSIDLDRLVEEMVLGRIARRALGGWTFTHATFRDAVISVSRDRATWRSRNRGCAAALQAVQPGACERRARLLLEAGDDVGAVDMLLEATGALQLEGDYGRVGLLLDEVDNLIDTVRLTDDDERLGRTSMLRVHHLRAAGDYNGALLQAENVVQQARRHGWQKLEADAYVELARILGVSMGEPVRALELFDRARALYEQLDDELGEARVAAGSSYVHISKGNAEDAARLADRAYELFEKVGDVRGLASSHYNLGLLARLKGKLDDAKAHYRRCLELAQRHGLRHTQGNAVDGIADIERHQGRYDEAEEGFREGMSIWDSIDSETDTSAVNLALLALLRRDGAQARKLLAPRVPSLQSRGDQVLLQYSYFCLAAADALLEDGVAFDEHFSAGRALFVDAPVPAGDLADLFDVAHELWLARQDSTRAAASETLAAEIRALLAK